MPRKVAILILCGLLAACAAGPAEPAGPPPLGADFGNAVRANATVHIVDPSPIYADEVAPPLNGKRAAGAMMRYENGIVTAPEAPVTSKRPN
jgi:hypothetical protein